MANESGRKVAIGFGKESSRGTEVSPTYWVKQTDLDFVEKATKDLDESSLNVLDQYSSADTVEQWAEGKVGGPITDRTFGLILAAAFGQAPSSASNADGSGDVYDHTYSQSQSNESLTLTTAIKDGPRDERYAMTMLKTLELDFENGKRAMWSAQIASKKPTESAGNTVSFVDENTFRGQDVSVKLADDVSGLSGASAIALTNLKLTIDRGVDPYFGLGSTDPQNIFAKQVSITGDLTALFADTTHRDSFLGSGYQAMEVTVQNADATIGSSAHPTLVLTFPRVSFTDWGLDEGLGNIVEQTLGLQALYSLSEGYSWSAVLTNLVTSY